MHVEIKNINPNTLDFQEISNRDKSLLTEIHTSGSFTLNLTKVESHIFSEDNRLIRSNYNNTNYSIQSTEFTSDSAVNNITLDPEAELKEQGIDKGFAKILYYIYNPLFGSSYDKQLFIHDISPDRTELRVRTLDLTQDEFLTGVSTYTPGPDSEGNTTPFYLNFENNTLLISVNSALNIAEDGNVELLVKLYEPLPTTIGLKDKFFAINKTADDIAFSAQFPLQVGREDDRIYLQGPNVNLEFNNQINNSTEFTTLKDIKSTPLTSSLAQINSLLAERGVELTIDYSDFNNFVHFSSAEQRINNFYYKLSEIQRYDSLIYSSSIGAATTSSLSASSAYYQNLKDKIIEEFDGYDYYLYYESGSKSWPKTNSTKPFAQESTSSVAGQAWLTSSIASASLYDDENQDILLKTTPEYLRDDSANEPYNLFMGMAGQMFDNIYIYTDAIKNRYDWDNRVDYGISKDLAGDALRSFGIKLYQNNFSDQDLYSAFLGITPSGSLLFSTGSELITSYVTSSAESIPADDITKLIYKRLYHNLPYLIKSKGTLAGIKALIACYGIPETILRISEFGGKDKVNTNDWDYYYDKFNYAYHTSGSGYINPRWPINTAWNSSDNVPRTVAFRFKTERVPTDSGYYSQSLFNLDGDEVVLRLNYTGSGFTSGSYSGSIIDPDYQYAHLEFYPQYNTDPTISASIYLPFFNQDWWGVEIIRSGSREEDGFEIRAGNKIYQGQDGTKLGFYATSSITTAHEPWYAGTSAFFGADGNKAWGKAFSGSLQEIRYYTSSLKEESFKDFIMNPLSTEGNGVNTSPNELAFRASLGGELYTGSTSIHPKVTGSWTTTSSFSGNSDFDITGGTFYDNREFIFFDQIPVGIKNRITDKVRAEELILPPALDGINVLSNIQSIEQHSEVSQSYTPNTNLLEVAFSPQNEINDDIIQQMGNFNIGDYIGDPRLVSSSNNFYPDLNDLRNSYFEKYEDSYGLWDYIRLIKYFDNSLFKMIKDFVPARTSLASGVVIKQHVLERNKYPLPQLTQSFHYFTGSIGQTAGLIDDQRYYTASSDYESNTLYTFSGGTGGSFEEFNKPVTLFRIVDSSVPVTAITSTPTILLNQGTISLSRPENGIGVGLVEEITNGVFKNITGYDIKGDIKVEIRNNAAQETFLLELVENNIRTIASVRDTLPQVTAPSVNSLTLKNCLLKSNQEYHFQLSTTTAPAQIVGIVRVGFVQLDAPENFRVGQMWSETIPTLSGSAVRTISDGDEFYDGEFSGSVITATTQSLNPYCLDNFNYPGTIEFNYNPIVYKTDQINFSQFLEGTNVPADGDVHILYDTGSFTAEVENPSPSPPL